jgi:N-methylhydantoinase B/oxoprolinase/acetone carboxylase alpha subunit
VLLNGREIGWGQPYLLRPGDRIVYRTPGGGGYGDPSLRDRDLLAREVADGLVGEATAREVFGAGD